MKKRDLLWKGIIRDFYLEFLRFFFPDHLHEIDLERGYEFLDKELEQIVPESSSKGRHADLLVKMYSPAGEEFWFLVHIEIQGYPDEEFAERMDVCYAVPHFRQIP
jgi:hypothetical protein